MLHAPILVSLEDLRGPERRVVAILRAWDCGPAAQSDIWSSLCRSIGQARARSCLQAFEQLRRLIRKHGWKTLHILAPETPEVSADEADLARFVMAATEQDRDIALAQATFLVSPTGLLPLLCAASRFGLPLLCEECRARILGATGQSHPH